MEVFKLPIADILTGTRKYHIPPYQRPYKWDVENVEQLIQDVSSSCQNQEKEYFIGSIICVKQEEGFEVVDGQQRLITLTLIMLQLGNLIEKAGVKDDLSRRIAPVNPYSGDSTPKPILSVRNQERDFYVKHILKGDSCTVNRHTTNTQKVFLNNMHKIKELLSEMAQDELITFTKYILQNMFVVFVQVDDRTSSFRLFNVLNSRGMSLNDADLLKNLLLERAATMPDRSSNVEKNWQEIETLVGEESLNEFLTLHQISEKKNRDRVKIKNYDYYESRLSKDFKGNSEKLSEMLLQSAKNYDDILDGESGAKEQIFFLKDEMFKYKPEWIPAFMAFLNNDSLCRKDFPAFASLFERIYMQSWLRNLRKSEREAPCYHAVESINKGESLDKIKVCLVGLANNRAFEESLDATLFYDGSRPQIINLVKAVLLRLDKERHDDNVRKEYSGRITVEHILPQDKSAPYWSERFSDDEHEEWLHKLGNLTLISARKNSAAKNYGFKEKKEAYNNLKTSFDITKEICALSDWNMQELQKRHNDLKDELKKLWQVD